MKTSVKQRDSAFFSSVENNEVDSRGLVTRDIASIRHHPTLRISGGQFHLSRSSASPWVPPEAFVRSFEGAGRLEFRAGDSSGRSGCPQSENSPAEDQSKNNFEERIAFWPMAPTPKCPVELVAASMSRISSFRPSSDPIGGWADDQSNMADCGVSTALLQSIQEDFKDLRIALRMISSKNIEFDRGSSPIRLNNSLLNRTSGAGVKYSMTEYL